MKKIRDESGGFRIWPNKSQTYICPTATGVCYGDYGIEGMKCGCPNHAPGFWNEREDGKFELKPANQRGFKGMIS